MNFPRTPAWVVVAIWLIGGSLQGADFRVMTWDLEDAYPPGKAAVLAKAVKKHKVDILALQSVQTTGTRFHQVIQNEIDKVFGKGVYRHAATTGSRFDGNAIFWNTRTIQVAGIDEDASLKRASSYQRQAQIVRAKAGSFDFVFVNVNLEVGVEEGEAAQVKQASILRSLLKKIEGRGAVQPLILAGNLQMSFPGEKVYDDLTDDFDVETNPAFQQLNTDDFLKFCTREVARKNPRVFSSIGNLLESGRLTDHIAANASAWKHYVKASAEVVRIDKEFYDSLEDYEWNFSDHLPVMAEFKTR